ncbi:MAG TPA: hypothetical protein VEH02_04100 [Pseudolabrys sp.]|nr:hypothetical protein [Pseudolabrys sp.]
MTPGAEYRKLAAQLRAKARTETSPLLRAEWEHLAGCYIRLAHQAERNSKTDVTYEPILRFGNLDGEPA